jgi:hypothetical protein
MEWAGDRKVRYGYAGRWLAGPRLIRAPYKFRDAGPGRLLILVRSNIGEASRPWWQLDVQ